MSPDKTSSLNTPTLQSSDVIATARRWLGTRWVHQGRSEAGIDCAGLVIKVHDDLGLPATDKQGYRRTPNGLGFLQHIREQTTFAPEPRPGVIGVFREAKFACHVGIFGWSDDYQMLTLIHAHAPAGKVVEQPLTSDWIDLLVECRNIIGITD